MTEFLKARAEVVKQTPHPMFSPSPFMLLQFDRPLYEINWRRIKREYNKAFRRTRQREKVQVDGDLQSGNGRWAISSDARPSP